MNTIYTMELHQCLFVLCVHYLLCTIFLVSSSYHCKLLAIFYFNFTISWCSLLFPGPSYKTFQIHHDHVRKSCFIALFFQLLIKAQNVLVFGLQTNSTFMSINFVNVQPLFSFFEHTSNINHLFEKMNALILRSYKIYCMYDPLLNQDLEDWVKARSTTGTWYS